MIGRSHDSKDQIHRHDELTPVDILDFDVVLGDHGGSSYDHVAPWKGETNVDSCCRVLLQQRMECAPIPGMGLACGVGGEHRPAGLGHPDVSYLTWAVDGDVVGAGGRHRATEGMAVELDGDAIAAVGHFTGNVGEIHVASPVHLGEALVFCSLFSPFASGPLTELGGDIRVGLILGDHVFSRSRQALVDTG